MKNVTEYLLPPSLRIFRLCLLSLFNLYAMLLHAVHSKHLFGHVINGHLPMWLYRPLSLWVSCFLPCQYGKYTCVTNRMKYVSVYLFCLVQITWLLINSKLIFKYYVVLSLFLANSISSKQNHGVIA